ncbi:MAG: metal ABC transporter permease [Thermoleophilaceae bacterium]|nr:metal ABC transporter permease [Thermoleophilaceae bacterium]
MGVDALAAEALGAVWHALADPWTSGIMRRAFLETALVGASAGALGCWVVQFQLSYGAESLAHALLPGLVLAALVGAPLAAGGLVGVVVAALATALAARTPAIGRDTAVAVVVTALVGLGALLALSPDTPPGVRSLLFGDVLAASDADLALAAGLGAVVLAALRLLHGRLLAVGFDRSAARRLGASPALVDAVLLVLLAAAIVVGIQGLGNLLVVATVIGPAAAARLLARRMPAMLGLAAALAVACGFAGLYLSWYASTAAGASIALALVAAYALCELWSRAARRRPVPERS